MQSLVRPPLRLENCLPIFSVPSRLSSLPPSTPFPINSIILTFPSLPFCSAHRFLYLSFSFSSTLLPSSSLFSPIYFPSFSTSPLSFDILLLSFPLLPPFQFSPLSCFPFSFLLSLPFLCLFSSSIPSLSIPYLFSCFLSFPSVTFLLLRFLPSSLLLPTLSFPSVAIPLSSPLHLRVVCVF